MNTQNGLPPKNNTESVSYIGGYFNNYIADILHISVRMTLISTYIFGIYVSYLLDKYALIRNKVLQKGEIGVCIIFDFFLYVGGTLCIQL